MRTNRIISFAAALFLLSGSLASAQVDSLKTIDKNVVSVSTALAGRLAGLMSIQSSGEPGKDGSSLYVRGVGTFGTTTPLLVVDGVICPITDLDIINPDDIESVCLLKDAASTAIYGIRGGNGVLCITTKRGTDHGRVFPRITFSTEQALLQPGRTPEVMGARDQALYFRTMDLNDGKPMRYTDAVISALESGSDPALYPTTNWFDVALTDKAHQQRYNVSISGTAGTVHRVNYFVSGSYLRQGSLMNYADEFEEKYHVKSGYDRFNFRSNVDFKATKRFSVKADFSASLETSVNPYSGSSAILEYVTALSPNSAAIFNPDGSIAGASALEDYSANPYGLLTRSAYCTAGNNAVWGTVGGKYDLNDFVAGLSVQASYSFKLAETLTRNWYQSFDAFNYLGKVGGEDVYSQSSQESRFSCGSAATVDKFTTYNLSVCYQRSFDLHNINATLTGSRTMNDLNKSQYTYGYQGISLAGSYNYNGRYFADLTLGVEGSENFHPDHRYGFFPALALGYLVKDGLKVRASYGLTGNDQIGGTRFLYMSEFAAGGIGILPSGYYFGTNNNGNGVAKAYNETNVANEFITWETARKLDLGVDASLMDGTLDVTFDLFHEHRSGILTSAGKVPSYTGLMNTPYRSAGIVTNMGFDFDIDWFRQIDPDFVVFASLNGVYARNKVLENDVPAMQYDYQELRGLPVGYSLGYHAIGFYSDAADIAASPKPSWGEVIPGDVKYEDKNEDGIINEDDRVPISSFAVPVFSTGLNMGFKWHGFDFSMLWTAALGGTATLYAYSSSIINLQRWSTDSKDALLPVAHTSTNNSKFSDYNIMKTDYLKLRNVEFGYTIPAGKLAGAGIQNIRVYVNVRNAFTLDSMWLKDRDPEAAGGAAVPYPIQRVCNIGVKLDI